MKKFYLILASVVIISGKISAASTDTVDVDMTPMQVDIAPRHIPIEEKIVELHMTEFESSSPEKKKRQRLSKDLGGKYLCSGSFIDGLGDIITAKHCVEKVDEIEVVTFDQKKYQATVINMSAQHDLALIHIDRLNTPFFSPATAIRRGEPIFILGSTLGITNTLSAGVIAKLDGDYTFLDCGALPGNSGSAVFDSNEQLVGVLTAGMIVMFGTTHLNIAQSIDAITFFVIESFFKSRN